MSLSMETFLSVCSFFQGHARERIPGCTRAIESYHGSENGQTHFTLTGLYNNHGCKIVIMYDPRSSNAQSLEGQGAGMGPKIGKRAGTLNHVIA